MQREEGERARGEERAERRRGESREEEDKWMERMEGVLVKGTALWSVFLMFISLLIHNQGHQSP